MPVDTSAKFVKPSTGRDLSNLAMITNPTELETGTISGAGWAQADLPANTMELLVPGSVLEIDYSSADGSIWIVLPDAACGWMFVAAFENTAYRNNSHSIAQISYEQIAAACGEDKTTWGTRIQAEAMSDWEVYSVRVGMKNEFLPIHDLVTFDMEAVSGGAWAQGDLPAGILDALRPGAVITMTYESADNSIWIVVPDSEAGWMRIAGAGNGTAAADGSVGQITYEQIAQSCGEDKATWGSRIQAEAMSDWTVYSVAVGYTAN